MGSGLTPFDNHIEYEKPRKQKIQWYGVNYYTTFLNVWQTFILLCISKFWIKIFLEFK
jgi:hypothetical protein